MMIETIKRLRDRQSWPEAEPGSVFLAEALLEIGRAKYGEQWTGLEFEGARLSPLPDQAKATEQDNRRAALMADKGPGYTGALTAKDWERARARICASAEAAKRWADVVGMVQGALNAGTLTPGGPHNWPKDWLVSRDWFAHPCFVSRASLNNFIFRRRLRPTITAPYVFDREAYRWGLHDCLAFMATGGADTDTGELSKLWGDDDKPMEQAAYKRLFPALERGELVARGNNTTRQDTPEDIPGAIWEITRLGGDDRSRPRIDFEITESGYQAELAKAKGTGPTWLDVRINRADFLQWYYGPQPATETTSESPAPEPEAAKPIPALQQRILDIAAELWPDGKRPARKIDRNNAIIAKFPKEETPPSEDTLTRAFQRLDK